MLFKFILVLHILSGSIGLLLGTFVLIRKKGDQLHRNTGTIFTVAMVSTGLCALYLSAVHPNLFLFIVGVFTLYLSISGYRTVRLKKVHEGQKPQLFDAILTFAMVICSLIFFYIAYRYLTVKETFGLVFALFGLVSLRLCYTEYKVYIGKVSDKKYWLKNHIGRMTGAYIAAFTAFLVVNNTYIPPIFAWSLPGIIGGIFISRTIKKLN